jgi:hypothetical protein
MREGAIDISSSHHLNSNKSFGSLPALLVMFYRLIYERAQVRDIEKVLSFHPEIA